MVLGIRDLSLEKALEEEPWQGPEWKKKKMPSKLSMFIECVPDDPTGSMVKDKAESFDPYYRKYGYRRLKRAEIKVASDEVAYNLLSDRRFHHLENHTDGLHCKIRSVRA